MRASRSIPVILIALAVSCGRPSRGPSVQEPPELLRAVPSDALCVGLFGRLDKGLDRMLDSLDILRTLDYGKLSHARAAVALCDIGALSPLVVVESGKHASDTSEAAKALLAAADTLRLSSAYVGLGGRGAVVLSPSETVITVVRRHLDSETSILDAPDFGKVLEALPGSDAVICRNSGIPKVFARSLTPAFRSRALPFMRDASEWTVLSEGRVIPVQPAGEKYFCNFCASLPEAPSRLARIMPDSTSFVLDIPVASAAEYRRAYEGWLDARVALEPYQARLTALGKASGIHPRTWEQGVDVREVAVVEKDGVRLNLVRTGGTSKEEGVCVNPHTGFVRALYGEPFNPADSCMLRVGNWIVSGPRAALLNYHPATEKIRSWPSKSRLALELEGRRLAWTNENIKIWDTNR